MTRPPAPTVGGTLAGADRQLISAALGEGETAREAWERWIADADLDSVDPGAFAILPAVSRNLDRHGIDCAESPRLRGIYRYSWTHAQLVLRDLADVQNRLAEIGVRSLVHRGVPMVQRALGDPAAVVQDQSYLLIGQEDLDSASDALAELGWHPGSPVPPREIRSAFEWIPFENPDRRRVSVRWRVFGAGSSRTCEEELMARAVTVDVWGRAVAVPEASDQVLVRCAEIGSLAPVQHLGWALELCGLLGGAAGRVDEDAVAERAEAGRVARECAAAFAAIRPFTDTIPGLRVPRLPALEGDPTTGSIGVHDSGAERAGRLVSALRAAQKRYRDVCSRDATEPAPWGLARFTAAFYGYEWGTGGVGLVAGGLRRWREGAVGAEGESKR